MRLTARRMFTAASPIPHNLDLVSEIPQTLQLNLIHMKLFIAIALLVATHVAGAKDYEIPEIGGTLSLSSIWIPADASITKAHNEDMLRVKPKTPTRYILAFTRGKPPDGFYSSTDYIWIQRTPMSNPPITPEQLTAMFPKMMTKEKPEMERLLKDRVRTVDPGAAHYEQRIGAVVWDASPTSPDGDISKMRSYLVVTKTSLINITVYSTPATADTVFEEVQGIVSTLKLKEDQKMPQMWTDRLKEITSGGK